MWFLYFLPILIAIPFLIARGRADGKVGPRPILFGLALVVAVAAAGFAAIELVR